MCVLALQPVCGHEIGRGAAGVQSAVVVVVAVLLLL